MIIPQVSTFWTRSLWERTKARLRNCNYAFDYDLWLEFASIANGTVINEPLGILRFHDKSKTGEENGMHRYLNEAARIRKERILSNGNHIIPVNAKVQLWSRYAKIKRGDYRAILGNRKIKDLYL